MSKKVIQNVFIARRRKNGDMHVIVDSNMEMIRYVNSFMKDMKAVEKQKNK